MTLYVGARDPEAISLIITDATFDFATVTAAQLRTTSPAGFDLPWSWTRTHVKRQQYDHAAVVNISFDELRRPCPPRYLRASASYRGPAPASP